jgi:hypothetical protein
VRISNSPLVAGNLVVVINDRGQMDAYRVTPRPGAAPAPQPAAAASAPPAGAPPAAAPAATAPAAADSAQGK